LGAKTCAPQLENPDRKFAGLRKFIWLMGITDTSTRRLERRWAPRYDFRADLDIEWGSATLRANTRDVSSNGMFIESVDPLWIGAGFTASLLLDTEPVKLVCSVKRVEPGRGMGVSVSFPEQQQETYLQLISRLSRT
jgi:hypothetical protein